MISLAQPVSDGVVARQPLALNSGTLACNTRGENVNESPKGLKITVGRKLGASPRPSVSVPKPPARPTLASREKNGSLAKRPCTPESTWINDVRAKLALSPPPRSSVPFTPNHEVVMPPLFTTDARPASPAMRLEPAYTSARPISWTELWACTVPANAASVHAAIRFVFIGSPASQYDQIGRRSFCKSCAAGEATNFAAFENY